MILQTEYLAISTRGNDEMVDLTSRITGLVEKHSVQTGIVIIFVPGSTAGITTIEHEPGLIRDFPEALEKIAPHGRQYHHDETWGDGNGSAHVRASLIGPSLTVPIAGGAMCLGTWQQIVLIDFDNRKRQRDVVVQLIGE